MHQIGQIVGSGDDLEVIKWNGMLDMARGHRDRATRQLYSVYTKMKGSTKQGQRDPLLAYVLARQFKDTPEVGMARGTHLLIEEPSTGSAPAAAPSLCESVLISCGTG